MGPSSTLIAPRPQTLLLGRYRLLERLGSGGFGVVWSAHDEQLHREVALKRIPLPGGEDRERATREALACARLSHPAIVALYEACADDEAFYLISELVHGRTLARVLADEELEDLQILEVGMAMARALEHAHSRGVFHRDVKPQNVIVLDAPEERAPMAKLADFGGARLLGEDALTRTGDVLGTLAYMAPEQSEGHEAGAPADVYSLGLVLYEALSGVNPVRGATPAATARRIGRPIQPLARHRRDLGAELTEAIDAALEPDPRARVGLAELGEILGGSSDGRPRDGWLARRGLHARARTRARGTPQQEHTHTHPTLAHPRSAHPPAQVRPTLAHSRSARLALPRVAWIATLAGLAAWQAALGLPGVSLLILAAGAPLLAGRRFGIVWLAGALAPALGMLGLAGAFPALAGQRARWGERAGLAALGFWWLILAESLLEKRLWQGPPRGLPARAVWEGSPGAAAGHAIAATVNGQMLVGMAVWAVAATVLPWIVRGRSAGLDLTAALIWAVALVALAPLIASAVLHVGGPAARGALLGSVLGCVVAVCARALRGPVCP